MTILPLECPHCGATLRIETDDPQYLKERTEQWEKEHEKCEVKK
jgi:hypothetical protein